LPELKYRDRDYHYVYTFVSFIVDLTLSMVTCYLSQDGKLILSSAAWGTPLSALWKVGDGALEQVYVCHTLLFSSAWYHFSLSFPCLNFC